MSDFPAILDQLALVAETPVDKDAFATAAGEIRRLQARVEKLEAALKCNEFDRRGFCPTCDGWTGFEPSRRRHTHRCLVAIALASRELIA
jgi:hypothetical protein